MSLTAPIPVVRPSDVQRTLADRIRAGEVGVRHQARLHPSLALTPVDPKGVHHAVDVGAWQPQMEGAMRSVLAAIERTLTAVEIPLDAGHVAFHLDHDEHAFVLTGTWSPS